MMADGRASLESTMRRSQLDEIIRQGVKVIASFGFKLPEFAGWSPDDRRRNNQCAGEVLRACLGWDITDFSRGEFVNHGLLLTGVAQDDPPMASTVLDSAKL
jgi:D-lyxose ketol-isomerase